MSKRGLPQDFRLRHDEHYVEHLTSRVGGVAFGRMIPLDKLAPNPNQPRKNLGDLSELTLSIKEKGVLEPILVRPSEVGGRFMIVSGERRYRASIESGLTEIPCIEMNLSDSEVAEIALIENLQRKDLDPFEESDGLYSLLERYSYTHQEIAQRIGKSRTSITESISLATLSGEIRELCRRADITAKSTLLQIVRQPTDDEMKALIGRIGQSGLSRDQAREITGGKKKNKKPGFMYQYNGDSKNYSVVVRFRKAKVNPDEIENALAEAIRNLKED